MVGKDALAALSMDTARSALVDPCSLYASPAVLPAACTSWYGLKSSYLLEHSDADDMTRRGKPLQHLMGQHHNCLEPRNPNVTGALDATVFVKSCNAADKHDSMLGLCMCSWVPAGLSLQWWLDDSTTF